jgi:transcriptional regulator with XRE-family HTH domain
MRSRATTDRRKRLSAPAGAASPAEDAPHPTDVHVGQRLRFRRSMLGLTQAQLAAKVGLTFQAIQKYERGENRISASRLHQFAGILGVPIADFFEGLPGATGAAAAGGPPSADDALGLSSREMHEVLRAYGAISRLPLRRSLLRLLRDTAAAAAEAGGKTPPQRGAARRGDAARGAPGRGGRPRKG